MMPDNAGQILRIDAIWLSREPLDMHAGPETALARVIQAFGAARPHHAYVFANKRANRMKILVCDGFGLWLAARRLHHGKFVWTQLRQGDAAQDAALAENNTQLAEQDAELARRAAAIQRYQIREEQLNHEMALLKRHRFGKRAEGISRAQHSLLEDLVDEDIGAIERELEHLAKSRQKPNAVPRSAVLYRRSCRARRSVTSPSPRPAPAVAS